ncbi:MAG: PD40 domain-containing protein [Phycisphaerales bacterium]|nr:PD40 domain-containing protein [Phycisphaerales bacterium]
MSASKITITIAALIVSGLAVAVPMFAAYDWNRRLYSDGDSIRRHAALDSPREVLWQPPRPLDELIQSAGDIYEPRLSWDGLTLYFVHGKAGANADIYTARRLPTGWTEPQPLARINSEYDDLGPEPSRDGRKLYFYSDRPDGHGGYDLWVAEWSDAENADKGEWLTPRNLGPAVNTAFNEYGPALGHDGRHLYFASNRPQASDTRAADPDAWPATVREEWFKRTYDLYVAEIDGSNAKQSVAIDGVNTVANEGAACVSPNGDFLYFASDRPGGAGGFDLFRCRIIRGKFEAPVNLGPAVNSADNELDPGLAQLGFALYFSSDRPLASSNDTHLTSQPASRRDGAETLNERRYRVYYTGSREVFVEREPIDWAGLWAATWPLLVWMLLGLLSALLLWQLIRDIRAGKLSLLARCLLASLLLHCLLMFGLGYWRVKAALGEYAGRGGSVKVTLAAAGVGGDLVAQVRGNLVTDIASPDTATVDSLRTVPHVAPQSKPELVVVDAPARDPAIAPSISTRDLADAREIASAPHSVPTSIGNAPQTHFDTPPTSPAVAQSDAPRAQPNAQPTDVVRSTPNVALAADSERPRRANVAPASADESAWSVPASPHAADARITANAPMRTAPPLAPYSAGASFKLNTPAAPRPVAAADESQQVAAAVPTPLSGGPTSRPAVGIQPEFGRSTVRVDTPVSEAIFVGGGDSGHVGKSPAAARVSDAAPRNADAPPIATFGLRPVESALVLALPRSASGAPAQTPPTDAAGAERVNVAPIAASGMTRSSAAPTGDATRSAQHVVAVDPLQHQPGVADPVTEPQGASKLIDAEAASGAGSRRTPGAADSSVIARGISPLNLSLPAPKAADATGTTPNKSTEFVGEALPPNDGRIPGDDNSSGQRPLGELFGKIIDADTRLPLRDVTVRFDQAAGPPLTAVTSADGTYKLPVAETPDHFAVTATLPGYLPESRNVNRGDVHGRRLRLDFLLRAANESVIAVEDEPEVHHLGNDLFEGVINSQFQRKSEGNMLVGEFSLSASQAPPHLVRVNVSMMVKGLQCPPAIRINGTTLARRSIRSPADGSFGEILLPIDPSLLREGENEISVQAVNCTGDLDDFEFVNVQIRLTRNEQAASAP